MSSFSCPHFDMEQDYCMMVRSACVPGQLGCVLRRNSVFAIPPEERLPASGNEAREAREKDERETHQR